MTKTIKNLGSFNTDKISLDDNLVSISIPFTAESEQVKAIIGKSYDAFRKAYPEAEDPHHETYIFFSLNQSMKPQYSFSIVIYDKDSEIMEYYDICDSDYSLSNDAKDIIKKIVWQQLSEMMFGK
ncbi:MAG: hypothetical protein NC452_05030 [Eubacterium sp.]|nr:hypothetical protein [Eubacterium sp.]